MIFFILQIACIDHIDHFYITKSLRLRKFEKSCDSNMDFRKDIIIQYSYMVVLLLLLLYLIYCNTSICELYSQKTEHIFSVIRLLSTEYYKFNKTATRWHCFQNSWCFESFPKTMREKLRSFKSLHFLVHPYQTSEYCG